MKPMLSLILLFPCFALAQTGAIHGRIMNKEGEPLPGVNILLQGTLRGTTSTSSGEFSLLNIEPGVHSLSFSLVGYRRETVSDIQVGENVAAEVRVEMTPVPIQADAVVVTAGKREQSLQEVPVSISVLDARMIAYRNPVAVDDALRYVPGVNLTEYQVNIRGSSGYSRGAGSRVLLLVDGIPFITGDTGELNFETIPTGQVDRIEVVKGASSALYGSSALGGVINIITKPIPEEPRTKIRLYGGLYESPSFNQWDWGGGARFSDGQAVSHSFRSDNLGVMLHASRMADDGYRQNDFRRRYNGYVKTRYDFSSQSSLTTTFNILHQRRGSFLYWKDLSHALIPPDAQQGDRVQSTRFFLSSQFNRAVSSDFIYNVRAMWFRNRWDDSIDTLTNNSLSNVLRGELQATWNPSAMHILTFGVEGNTDAVSADLFGERNGGGFAAYVQDDIEVMPNFKLTVGARFDFQDVDSLESNSQLNPKAGVLFTPGTGTTIRASFGRGFRTPAVAEAFIVTQAGGLDIIPNPGLKPERSSSYEIAASQFLGETAIFDVALFQSGFSDLIEPRFVSVGGTLKGQFNNVTKARVQGVEASIKSAFFEKNMFVDIGYTYVYPKDLTQGGILKYRPRHILYAGLLTRSGMFTAGVDFRYISRIERIDEEFKAFVNDADERVATYVTDVRLGVDLEKAGLPLSVNLNINNIFQYIYVELIGNLMPPRNYVLVVEAAW